MVDDVTREEFEILLSGTCDQITELASCIIDFLASRNEDDQTELMEILISTFGAPGRPVGVALTGRKMHDARFRELGNMLGELVSGTIKLIIHTRVTLPAAAKTLRDLVFNLDDVEQRDYCLAAILGDDAIPYRPIARATASEFPAERLETIARTHMDKIFQINCIRRAGFGTTVQSELLLKVLDAIEPYEDRIGVMEYLLTRFLREIAQAQGLA